VKKLTVAHLVKKFPVVWNRNFSNIFTTTWHLSLSWASWIQFAPSFTISFKLASVLSYYPYAEFQEISFLKILRLKFYMLLISFNALHMFSWLISSAEWKSRSSPLGNIASNQQRNTADIVIIKSWRKHQICNDHVMIFKYDLGSWSK
jgi:hypothetical protein